LKAKDVPLATALFFLFYFLALASDMGYCTG